MCQFNQVTIEDITTQLVLETDEETKDPIIEVHKKLICKLKPHQVDGMYCRICAQLNETTATFF